jgi:hypothetical protein
VKLTLVDLRLSEEFRTALTGEPGLVLDWGHIRSRSDRPPRHHIPVVVAQVAGKRKLLPPNLLVLVDEDRPHWSSDRRPEPAVRWKQYVGQAEDEEDEND